MSKDSCSNMPNDIFMLTNDSYMTQPSQPARFPCDDGGKKSAAGHAGKQPNSRLKSQNENLTKILQKPLVKIKNHLSSKTTIPGRVLGAKKTRVPSQKPVLSCYTNKPEKKHIMLKSVQ